MMYGKLIKEIRVAKGMKQKEIYLDVVSKSFYSDFEAGKNSIEVSKFLKILDNLGLTFHEFECYQQKNQENIENNVDDLYKQGKFEELYSFYEEYYNHSEVSLRQAATKAYLLVLITNTNFYRFSREPFREIVSEIENYKTWYLKEISLAKLVLLSLSETDKVKAKTTFNRILLELEKYLELDKEIYDQEVADLFFNRVQSLLILNDVKGAEETYSQYKQIIEQSDSLHLLLQLKFIGLLVGLYLNFPVIQNKLKLFLETITIDKSSEYNFYKIIFSLHEEKAKSYYTRYREGK